MPKIKITEIDNTGFAQSTEVPNVVFIPGVSISGKKTSPVLYTSYSSFMKDANKYLNDDASFKMAKELLRLGLHVLYQGFVPVATSTNYEAGEFKTAIEVSTEGQVTTKTFVINSVEYTITNNAITADSNTYPLVNGVVNMSEYIGEILLNPDAEPEERVYAEQIFTVDFVNGYVLYTVRAIPQGSIVISSDDWALLEDRNLYDIRFLTTGGYAGPTTTTVKMLECAANRGDCVALLDHPDTLTTVAGVREFFATLTSPSPKKNKDNPLSFSAAFTPWFTAELFDEEVHVPASFGYLCAFATAIKTNPIWFAVAGSFRGVIPELVNVDVKYTSSECEVLQARGAEKEVELDDELDNVGFAINPIALENPYGYVIWGNRTFRANAGELKSSSILNCRMLVSEVNKTLYRAAKRYTFEQNSDVLWVNFTSMITPTLDKMKSGDGVEDYAIVKLGTNKKARLKARVMITPIEGVEDFDMEIYMADSIEVSE